MRAIDRLADELRKRGSKVSGMGGSIHWRDSRGWLWYAHDHGRYVRLELVNKMTPDEALEVAR